MNTFYTKVCFLYASFGISLAISRKGVLFIYASPAHDVQQTSSALLYIRPSSACDWGDCIERIQVAFQSLQQKAARAVWRIHVPYKVRATHEDNVYIAFV